MLAISNIVDLFTTVFNGLFNALNVKIPGFPITISELLLGLFIFAVIVNIFQIGSDKK